MGAEEPSADSSAGSDLAAPGPAEQAEGSRAERVAEQRSQPRARGLTLSLLLFFGLIPPLPLLGLRALGLEQAPFLEPLPRLGRVAHAPFSWPATALVGLLILATLAPFAWRALRYAGPLPPAPPRRAFPSWGWAGLLALGLSWGAAWTRLPSLAGVQGLTFTPLWLAYVVVVSALAERWGGRPVLAARRSWLLWPLSLGFWWLFEYLNRFVESWDYEGADFSHPLSLLVHGTLPMATVLPAVVATQDLLARSPRLCAPFRAAWRLPLPSRVLAAALLLLAAASLVGLPVYPNLLFPCLWLAPIALLLWGPVLAGSRPALLDELSRGDWRRVVTYALAALLCGLCWEGWNAFSLARWTYAIPYVGGLRLFEMPLLGYAGYPAFGVECALAAGLVGVLGRRGPAEPPLSSDREAGAQ